MEALFQLLETAMIVTIGLTIRFALLLVGIAVLLAIVLPLVYGTEGVRMLWSRVALQHVAGLRWRAHTYYTPAHEWVRERAGRLRIGLDDLAAHLIGRADAITLPVAGTHVNEGDLLLTVGTGLSKLRVRAPVEGVVKRVNPHLVNHPSAMTTDPYRRGWLVEIAPANDRHRRFLHDDAARTWFASEAVKLSSALEHATGIAAADGGELLLPSHEILGEAQLNALARQFLHDPEEGGAAT
jgi:glycine cleavage system H protein